MPAPDRIMKIIKVLMAKIEKGAEGSSEAEIQEALKKVQQLMLEHNLSEKEVISHQLGKKEEEVSKREINLNEKTKVTEGQWLISLYYALARANMCIGVHDQSPVAKNMGRMLLYGSEMNLELVMYLADSVRNQLKIMAKEAYKKSKDSILFNPNQNAFRRAYLDGAVSGIKSKLQESLKENMAASSAMGLMVIDEEKRVLAYINKDLPNVGVKSKANYGDKLGKSMGYNDGRNMGLNKGLGGAGGRKMIS